jgi:hypothetical protein
VVSRFSETEAIPDIPGLEALEPVGRGGFGAVYRGRQPDLDREVAVKVVLSQAREADIERWRKEVAAMGRLSNHPNILGVYSAGVTAAGLPYLVMPYVPLGSLWDRIASEGPMEAAEVASLGEKLAGALSAAHSVGVLHLDVKPENVLLSPYGEPQLTDFGIARLLDSTTTVGGPVHATVRYAAPEVLSGQPASESSDIYSLGATLFACLTGAPPFAEADEQSVVALVGRIANEAPADLIDEGVPAGLASAIARMLAKSPSDRPATAEEVRSLFESSSEPEVTAPAPVDAAATVAAPVRGGAETTETVPEVAPRPAPAVQPAAPRRRDRRVRRGSRSLALPAALAVLVAGLAALLFFVAGADRDRGADNELAAGGAASDTTGVEDEDTDAEDTDSSATSEGDASASEAIGQRAVAYFEAISRGNFSQSYSMLSPQFRRRQSQADYEGFWGSVGPVTVVGEASVDADNLSAVVPITVDGRREDFRLTFIQADDGTWFVNGPQPG